MPGFFIFPPRNRPCHALTRLFALLFALSLPLAASGVTPDSPEVKAMVEKALKFLEGADDERLGAKCLVGLSFYKAGKPTNHPKILTAISACQSSAGMLGGDGSAVDNYSVGLAMIFLLEIDPERHRSLAYRYLQEILRREHPQGGWGYAGEELGDTSQTQYPTLALWLAINNGIDVPMDAVQRDCGWLLRTQDPSGAWGYKGNDPGHYRRVQQSEIRPALAAAGLGSLYMCADLLKISERKPKEEKSAVPSALKPVGDPLDVKPKAAVSELDARIVRQSLNDGNAWFRTHYGIESEGHTHYFLYALERYHSFREAYEKSPESNPRWYADIVEYLKKTHSDDGSWAGNDGVAVCTSFSALALLRSAKKTIATVVAKLGEGVLLGGLGLPKNTADLQERDGKIVESALTGTIDELLTTIEKGNTPELQRLTESPARWKLDSDVTKRSGEINRLRAVVAAGSFESRLLAVRALGRVRELDNVPVLIYALSDPDMRVVREADKGLRFISRKFDGVGLPEEPKPEQARAAIGAWKAWYQSIRPNAEFLD
jgi:hypothetical protein